MNHSRRALLFTVGALFFICVTVWILVLAPNAKSVADLEPAWLTNAFDVAAQNRAAVAALLAAASTTLDDVTKVALCQVVGALPDHGCSPGSVFGDATPEIICVSGYTKTVRNVSVSLKKKVYTAYGISYPQPTGSYEMDHLIPLELGGDNSTANLFPESAEPKPGFKEKDVVEDYLHEEVCAGHLNLRAAQVQIADNWVAVYQALDQATIVRIKQRFRSWAD